MAPRFWKSCTRASMCDHGSARARLFFRGSASARPMRTMTSQARFCPSPAASAPHAGPRACLEFDNACILAKPVFAALDRAYALPPHDPG